MKHLYLITAMTLALAGCSKAADSDEAMAPAATTTSAMAPAAATPGPNVATPGTYTITNPDGTTFTETFAADSTYTDTKDGKEIGSGTWRVDGDKTCLTAKGEKETCFAAEQPGADGSFKVMGPDGKVAGSVSRPS